MSDDPKHDQDGRHRPLRGKGPKKLDGGKSRRRKQKKRESVASMVDRLLLTSMDIALNGEKRRVHTITAIMFQLFQKALAGNTRAKRILLKYKEFAKLNSNKRLRVAFVDNDYTRAVAKPSGGDGE